MYYDDFKEEIDTQHLIDGKCQKMGIWVIAYSVLVQLQKISWQFYTFSFVLLAHMIPYHRKQELHIKEQFFGKN